MSLDPGPGVPRRQRCNSVAPGRRGKPGEPLTQQSMFDSVSVDGTHVGYVPNMDARSDTGSDFDEKVDTQMSDVDGLVDKAGFDVETHMGYAESMDTKIPALRRAGQRLP